MLNDPVLSAFLAGAATEAAWAVGASRMLHLAPAPGAGDPPSGYQGLLRGVEHFERHRDGTIRVSDTPVAFQIDFPADYLRSVDPSLQFRVVRLDPAVVHPNAKGGGVCLGRRFRPGTRLRFLLEQLHAMIAGRAFATDDALDPEARSWFIQHPDEVRALKAAPLWDRAVSRSVSVEEFVRVETREGSSEPVEVRDGD